MGDPLVLVEKDGGVTTLTINNPKMRNSLSFELVEELAVAVENIKKDKDVLAVILTGAGKGFSSGGDVKSMIPPEGMGDDEMANFIKGYYLKNLSVMEIPHNRGHTRTRYRRGVRFSAGLRHADSIQQGQAQPGLREDRASPRHGNHILRAAHSGNGPGL